MKRLSLILLLLASVVSTMAYGRRHTMLKVRLSDDSPIAVRIDGRYIDRETASLTLDGLRPGWHRLEVYSMSHARVRPFRIYTGSIRLKAGTVNIAVVDVRDRILRMRTRAMDEQDLAGRSGTSRSERERPGSDDIYDGAGQPDTNVREGYGSFPRGRGNVSAATEGATLSEADMEALRKRIAARTTDTDKEALLKSELKGQRVTTAQVRSMLGWFAFESTRLEVAKWAYDRSADPERYSELEDIFDFDASRKELSEAIRKR